MVNYIVLVSKKSLYEKELNLNNGLIFNKMVLKKLDKLFNDWRKRISL
jgi:hypothetical protein